MNKVMTRTQHHPAAHPGTRPPTRRDPRRDTRRPGGAPPRARRTPTPHPAPAPAPTPPASALRPAAPAALTPPRVPPQTPRRPVPQPRPTDVFADRLLLVLSGQRPVHSMLRHTVGRAYDDLAHLAETGPLRSLGARPVVRDVGYYVPRPGAFEAFARIGTGDRLRAMAFRLELGRDHRWRCTAVELDGPRRPHPEAD